MDNAARKKWLETWVEILELKDMRHGDLIRMSKEHFDQAVEARRKTREQIDYLTDVLTAFDYAENPPQATGL